MSESQNDENAPPFLRPGEVDSAAEEPILITSELLDRPQADVRIDFERGIRHAPPITLTLLAVNALAFIWEVAIGALANQKALLAAGALHRPEVMRGEYWRLASSMFLHADPQHLIGNCVALYILGMAGEHAFGRSRFLAVYLLSGLAGSLARVLTDPRPTVGASGAIFGMLGAVVAFLYRYRNRFYVRDARIGAVLAVWAVYQLGSGWLNPHIANMAHLGGFGGGMLLGLIGFDIRKFRSWSAGL